MKSSTIGKNTSQAEVQDITKHGVWLYVQGKEYLLSYKDFPWFKDAKVSEIYNVEFVHEGHLHWPDIDVDIEIDSLKNPNNYPLVFR